MNGHGQHRTAPLQGPSPHAGAAALRCAAQIEHESLTEFVLSAAAEHAETVLSRQTTVPAGRLLRRHVRRAVRAARGLTEAMQRVASSPRVSRHGLAGSVFVCSRYDERGAVEAFDCGQPDLNEWRTRHARTAQAKRTAQVFVWTEEADTAVLATSAYRRTRSLLRTCRVGSPGGHAGADPGGAARQASAGQASAGPGPRRPAALRAPTSACWPPRAPSPHATSW